MLINTATESNLISFLRTDWACKGDLCSIIILHTRNSSTSSRGSNINHENFRLLQLGYSSCLRVAFGLDTKKTTKQIILHFNLDENKRKLPRMAKNMSNESISTSKSWVNLRTNTNQTTWNSELQIVLFGCKGNNS